MFQLAVAGGAGSATFLFRHDQHDYEDNDGNGHDEVVVHMPVTPAERLPVSVHECATPFELRRSDCTCVFVAGRGAKKSGCRVTQGRRFVLGSDVDERALR